MIYDISYKNLIDSKPLHIRFYQIDEFIRIRDGTRYLTFFVSKKYNAIYNRIRYFIRIKSGIRFLWQNDSFDPLSIERILTLHRVILHVKSVLNNNKNHYFYKIFLEKCLYQLAKI